MGKKGEKRRLQQARIAWYDSQVTLQFHLAYAMPKVAITFSLPAPTDAVSPHATLQQAGRKSKSSRFATWVEGTPKQKNLFEVIIDYHYTRSCGPRMNRQTHRLVVLFLPSSPRAVSTGQPRRLTVTERSFPLHFAQQDRGGR